MAADDEPQLIARARGGDHGAFRTLVEKHIRGAYDLAVGFVGDHDTAEDVVQEAFVRAYAGLRAFRGDSHFATWLHRIVVNLSLNSVKRLKLAAEKRIPAPELAVADGFDTAAQSADTRAHIERALHELPTLQRAVVILRHMEGMSTREVSRVLQCSEGTVKTHLFRGLGKLRKKLRHLEDQG
jgi:RNA polymerase sigma-70 factor (ECF subfamily)